MLFPSSPAKNEPASIHVLQSISLNFLHGSVDLAQHPERAHLVGGILLADLAHGKADVNEHPVAGYGLVIMQQSQIDPAPDSNYIHERGVLVVGSDLDDPPRNG